MKNVFKKILCVTFSLSIITASAFGASAYQNDANISTANINVDPSRVSSKELLSAYSDARIASGENQALINKLVNGISNFDESIDVSAFNATNDEISSVMDYIRYEYPELVQYKGGYRYSYNSKIVLSVTPNYLFTKAEKDSYIIPLNEAIDKVVAEAEEYSDDFQKLLFVHDYLATNCEYAQEVLVEGSEVSPFVYTAYGCLVNKHSVCQGYSFAYKAILKRLSIPCGFASSEIMNHIWNIVTVGGKSYHIDVTYDDPISDLIGRVMHENFLCTDKEITATGHNNWVTDFDVSDVTYSGRFWDEIDSKIIISGDDMVYAAYDKTKNKSMLEKRSYKTQKVSTIPSALDSARWKVLNSNSYYTDNYSRLELVGNDIYYSLPNGVNAIGIDGSNDRNVYTLTDTSNGYLYGFVENDKKFYGEIKKRSTDDSGQRIELPIEYPKTVLRGDIDNNGEVTVSDAIMVQKHIVNIITLSGDSLIAADVDNSDDISVADAILIQKLVVGIVKA